MQWSCNQRTWGLCFPPSSLIGMIKLRIERIDELFLIYFNGSSMEARELGPCSSKVLIKTLESFFTTILSRFYSCANFNGQIIASASTWKGPWCMLSLWWQTPKTLVYAWIRLSPVGLDLIAISHAVLYSSLKAQICVKTQELV